MEITAHRGASAYAPENTIASIEKALEIGVDCIEIDIQQTRDGKLILLHDPGFLRTAGINKNVWEVSYSEIANLDVGSWFSGEYNSQYPPLLSDVFELTRNKCKLNLEMKYNGRNRDIPNLAAEIVTSTGEEERVIITSFNLGFVNHIKHHFPRIRTGYIASFPYKPAVWVNPHPVASLNKIASQKLTVGTLKKLGKEVHIWTADKEKDIRRAIAAGADNIISNRPDVVKAIVAG